VARLESTSPGAAAPEPQRQAIATRALSRSELIQASLFFGASLLVAGVFVFTNQVITRLSDEITATSRVLARFCAQASFPAVRDPELGRILVQVISNVDFPIVISDTLSMPRAWRKLEVDESLVPDAAIDSLVEGRPIAPVIRARIERVRVAMARLDRLNPPIPMIRPVTGERLGSVHYGDPAVLERLRWMPYLSGGGMVVLLSLGVWGLAGIRSAERRTIWVGMARETAHQLGTPLSSLMGWIELLRAHASKPTADQVRMPRAELEETLGEMERDVERLTKVAQRFSHVGSAPDLALQDVRPVVRGAVDYVRRRLPQGEGEIVILERYQEVPPVKLGRELLAWAVENLLTNAVSAIERRPGRIEVVVEPGEGGKVHVIVTDNGRGMSPPEQRRAFEPGYTTKRRGWGLGLALARRAVEEYHRGRLYIRRSVPGEGTTLVIELPV